MAGTGLAGMMAMAGGAQAGGIAPVWHLTGNANFQAYWIDQDAVGLNSDGLSASFYYWTPTTLASQANVGGVQEHDWYFGVDEAELQLEVSGSADNGLNYGFKIEINANTTDEAVADEARLELFGRWGTLQLGDEDGADNVMKYGGETLLGGTGGFDGDHDDYLFRAGWAGRRDRQQQQRAGISPARRRQRRRHENKLLLAADRGHSVRRQLYADFQ